MIGLRTRVHFLAYFKRITLILRLSRPRRSWNPSWLAAYFAAARQRPEADLCFMLHYALVFLVVAIIAAIFGFGSIAGTAAWIAKVLFVVFLVLFLISLVTGRRPKV